MRIRKIKFRGIDSWNRPVYKVLAETPYYIGDVAKLFDFTDTKETVDAYYKNNLKELVYFGEHFDCEPMGTPLAKDIQLEFEEAST